ncbi:hypothetical protein [Streptomyces acidicola]|uniref:hypothetical protein n=1 Tax=Streptomyces acidicola TaxID=2596892 RepID=UPI0034278472
MPGAVHAPADDDLVPAVLNVTNGDMKAAVRHSERSVARQLGMGLNTILRFSRATEPEQSFTGQWQSGRTKLDAYKTYLDQQ